MRVNILSPRASGPEPLAFRQKTRFGPQTVDPEPTALGVREQMLLPPQSYRVLWLLSVSGLCAFTGSKPATRSGFL